MVVIMHSNNEKCDYVFSEKPTSTFVGDDKIFVKFVSKYPWLGDEKLLKCLLDTRWEAHAIAIEAILWSYPQIIEALEY